MPGKKEETNGLPTVYSEELKNLGLQDYLKELGKRYQERVDMAKDAQESAQDTHEVVAPGGKMPHEQQWFTFAPLPTDMCRISPFFPLNQKQLKDRPYIENMVITKSSWGKIIYAGPKLSVLMKMCCWRYWP